jgi:hypothetical protein
MQKLFFLSLAFCVSLGAAIGVFLYISLIPYFFIIGRFAAGLLAFGLVCVAVLIGTFTWSQVGIMLAKRESAIHHRRVITSGDVVVYLDNNGNFTHLSAMHEAAKIAPPAPIVNALPAPTVTDETIIEMFTEGITLRSIVEATGEKYHRVQSLTEAYKKRHATT